MDEKNAAEAEANRCAAKLDRANRLVNALGSESTRWSEAILNLGQTLGHITGDVLLASAFVSYVGPFNKKFRDSIIADFKNYFHINNIPLGHGVEPVTQLTNPAEIALWNSQGLPSDIVSVENGSILTKSERFPLIIDPQLQGIVWIKNKESNNDLQITRLANANKMIKCIEFAIETGQSVLIENIGESIDAILAPVYSRAIIKRGKNRYLKIGDKELGLHDQFKLFFHTKLSNPHYSPEIQAECTLINFTVTELGLEDQLLALVVKKERPDLSSQKEELIKQSNEFKIKLGQLEASLLKQLAEAEGDILDNIELIENLETSKRISVEITEKVNIAKVTEAMINEASEAYRPAASRGALVFFLMNELYKVHSFYMFSLESFVIVVNRAIDIVSEQMKKKKKDVPEGEPAEGEQEDEEEDTLEFTPKTLKIRVQRLIDSITFEGFNYTRRGTFEQHKLLISTMLCFRILIRKGEISQSDVNSLIKREVCLEKVNQPVCLKFYSDYIWSGITGLDKNVPAFGMLL
jgi:dynein heavy chain, axonemal